MLMNTQTNWTSTHTRDGDRESERLRGSRCHSWCGEARGGDLEFFMTTEYRDDDADQDDVSKRFGMILSGLESNDIPCRCGKNLL